ncbi:MAG: endonuclease [Bacteroides sp.]|uniref:endonuclease/exonuclease/phosphatase family protein n=1 Tax=Bacteroides sp. TaxID=29523 RepID=UPI001B4EE127|nr:endonuclease [Bacteroides sp.]MBP9586735.1 endonuclease [Bacteroides sp.]
MSNRNSVLIVTLLLCLSTTILPAQEQPRFRVMWWNVENLFDTRHDTLKNDREFLPDGLRHWNYGRYKKKLGNLARVITAVGEWTPPVLVGLCEVENDTVLRDLTCYSPLAEQGYRYVMTDSPDERGIDVALLYQPHRFKLLSQQSIRIGSFNGKNRPTRDVLHVCGLLLNNDTIDVFVCHFPSRSGGVKESEPYRLFVAEKVRTKADSLMSVRKQPKLIIMGDLNDYPENRSIAKVLGAVAPPMAPEPCTLYHLLARKARQRHFGSYKYQGQWGLLDHLIVSGSLIEASSSFYTSEDKANVFQAPFILTEDEKTGGKQPFRTYNGMKYQGGYSDHLPIYTDFFIKEIE